MSDRENSAHCGDSAWSADCVVLKRYANLAGMAEGDVAVVIELLELFQQQTPQLMSELREAVSAGNWHEITTISHTLKPTFEYMEMQIAYRLANELEACGESGDKCRCNAQKLCRRLCDEVERSLEEVAAAIVILQRSL